VFTRSSASLAHRLTGFGDGTVMMKTKSFVALALVKLSEERRGSRSTRACRVFSANDLTA